MSFQGKNIDAELREKQWVQVQIKAFSAWVNSYLERQGMRVENLETDFEDGVKLVIFLEILSGRKLKGTTLKPNIQIQKIQNLAIALKFITDELKVRLLGVGPEEIHKGNIKLVLGMLWSVFRKMRDTALGTEGAGGSTEDGLLQWVRKMTEGYAHVDIRDFKTSFSDGMAFSALIHKLHPEHLNFDGLDPNNKVDNLNNAFGVAEKNLGIPQLLSTDDLVGGVVDERSVILYVSLYFHAYVSEQAQNRDKEPIANQLKQCQIDLEEERNQRYDLEKANQQLEERAKNLQLDLDHLREEIAFLRKRAGDDASLQALLEEKINVLANLLEKESGSRGLDEETRNKLRKEIDELRRREQAAADAHAALRNKLSSEQEDNEKSREELEAARKRLQEAREERQRLLNLMEERKKQLSDELTALRKQVELEIAVRKQKAAEAERLRLENEALKKRVIGQAKARNCFDILKRSLEEHIEDLYKWRELNNFDKTENPFNLSKVIADIGNKNFDEQIDYFNQKLDEENQSLLRIIKLQDSKGQLKEVVKKEGWLLIKGRKEWKKRWFKLAGHTLSYSESETAEQFEGCVDLTIGCDIVRQKAVKEDEGSKKLWPLKLTVQPNRKLFIRAPSKQERHAWFSLISSKIAHINYIKEAEKSGNRPDTRIISFLTAERLNELHLDGHRLYPEGVTAIAKALPAHDTLEALSLSNAELTDESVAVLGDVLDKLSLKVLKLGGNKFTSDGVAKLAQHLSAQAGLVELHLNDIGFDASAATAIASAAEKHPGLTTLNVNGNNIGNEGAHALTDVISKSLANLSALHLSNNNITCKGAESIGNLLAKNGTILVAHLSKNKIGDKGAQALADALEHNTVLHTLELSENYIGAAGAVALQGLLKKNRSLDSVNLSINKHIVGSHALASLLTEDGFSFPQLSFARINTQ